MLVVPVSLNGKCYNVLSSFKLMTSDSNFDLGRELSSNCGSDRCFL